MTKLPDYSKWTDERLIFKLQDASALLALSLDREADKNALRASMDGIKKELLRRAEIYDSLKEAYTKFISEYDPYSQEAQPDTLEGMLYNLEEINKDLEADTDDLEMLKLKILCQDAILKFRDAGIRRATV